MFVISNSRKSKVVESQLPDELAVEEDDIITDTPPPTLQHALFSAPQGQSQPVGKVFVERTSESPARSSLLMVVKVAAAA